MNHFQLIIFLASLLISCTYQQETASSNGESTILETNVKDTSGLAEQKDRPGPTPSESTLIQFISGLDSLDIPVTFEDSFYLLWPEKNLPTDLFSGAKLDIQTNKAIGVIRFPDYYIILTKRKYNDDTDTVINGVVFDRKGKLQSFKTLYLTSSGEDLTFAIPKINEIQLLKSGPEAGTLKSYSIDDGHFVQQGETLFIEDVNKFLRSTSEN